MSAGLLGHTLSTRRVSYTPPPTSMLPMTNAKRREISRRSMFIDYAAMIMT
jgi:hypothetical protein